MTLYLTIGMLNEDSNVRYAGLYFCICVDVSDNNLYYLEVKGTTKIFVETGLNLPSSGHPQLCGGAERILSQRL